jgi:hypothetical protein
MRSQIIVVTERHGFGQSLIFHSEKEGACRDMEETGPVLLPGFVNFSSDTNVSFL